MSLKENLQVSVNLCSIYPSHCYTIVTAKRMAAPQAASDGKIGCNLLSTKKKKGSNEKRKPE